MKIGIWTDGFDTHSMTGPWLGLYRTLSAADFPPSDEVTLIHTEEYDDSIYDEYEELIISKSPSGKLRLAQQDFDVIVANAIPSTIPSYFWHSYPNTKFVCYAHGSLAWVPETAYSQRLFPDTIRGKVNRKMTKQIMSRAIKNKCDSIVTNSNFLKRTFTDGVDVDGDKFSVAHYGVDNNIFYQTDKVSKDYLPNDPYIFSVANYKPRKNPQTIVRAIAKLHERGMDYNLVVAGSGYSNSPIPSLAEELGIRNSIEFLGFVDEKELASVYTNSEAFVFTTLHENFGMPILEAMATGTPVITSNYTAMPEVADDAAILIDEPTNPAAVANGIERVVTNDTLREDLVERGIERSKEFTWDKTANTFINTLHKYD